MSISQIISCVNNNICSFVLNCDHVQIDEVV